MLKETKCDSFSKLQLSQEFQEMCIAKARLRDTIINLDTFILLLTRTPISFKNPNCSYSEAIKNYILYYTESSFNLNVRIL